MDQRDLLLTALKTYTTSFKTENPFIQEMIDFIQKKSQLF